MRLNRGNGLALDQNSKGFILLGCYEISKPGALCKLWRRFGRQVHLIGRNCENLL